MQARSSLVSSATGISRRQPKARLRSVSVRHHTADPRLTVDARWGPTPVGWMRAEAAARAALSAPLRLAHPSHFHSVNIYSPSSITAQLGAAQCIDNAETCFSCFPRSYPNLHHHAELPS